MKLKIKNLEKAGVCTVALIYFKRFAGVAARLGLEGWSKSGFNLKYWTRDYQIRIIKKTQFKVHIGWAWATGLLPMWSISRANLSRANLYGADLSRADLSRANLYGADLSRADLSRANLSGAESIRYIINPPQEILDEIERRRNVLADDKKI